jgi:WD40 repeat protein
MVFAVSADRHHFATVAQNGSVHVRHASTGQIQTQISGPFGHVYDVALSADATLALICVADGTKLCRASGTGVLTQDLGPDESVRIAALSDGGKRAITATNNGSVRVWGTDDWHEMVSLPTRGRHVREAAIVSAIGCIYVHSFGTQRGAIHYIQVFDAGTGEEIWHLSSEGSAGEGAAPSPDGRRLATFQGHLRVFETDTGVQLIPQGRADELRGRLQRITFSPDGSQVAALTDEGPGQHASTSKAIPQKSDRSAIRLTGTG